MAPLTPVAIELPPISASPVIALEVKDLTIMASVAVSASAVIRFPVYVEKTAEGYVSKALRPEWSRPCQTIDEAIFEEAHMVLLEMHANVTE